MGNVHHLSGRYLTLSRRARRSAIPVAGTLTAGLAAVLLGSSSGMAIAACAPAPSAGDDIIECHDDNGGALDLQGGNDKLTVNTGAIITGVTGNTGNDRIEINDGTINGNVRGNGGDDTIIIRGGTVNGSVNVGAGSQGGDLNQHDRAFLFGGTVDGEFQNGAGQTWSFLFGGTVTETTEMQRGSVDSVIVVDGATLIGGFEMQNPNNNPGTTGALSVNPTFYLRSGFIGAGTWGNANDSHFIFDPINSIDPDSLDPDAPDIEAAFRAARANPNEDHMLTIGADDDNPGEEPTLAFGNGNDTVDFIGAVNFGEGRHNLHFGQLGEDVEEVPVLDGDGQEDGSNAFGIPGTPGNADTLNVAFGSNLLLGDVINFEVLNVLDSSLLTLQGEEYEFGDSVTVDGSSAIAFTGSEVQLETEHLALLAPGDGAEAVYRPASQFAAFAPGGMLLFGQSLPTPGDDEGDDDAEVTVDAPETGVFEIQTGAATFSNAGTVATANGVAGDLLTIHGGYESIDGKFAIDSVVRDAASATDRIDIDGPITGTTTIYVNNLNQGEGALTGQGATDGLVIVRADQGGMANDAFVLPVNIYTGEREVISGAFAYRLVVGDDAARLQSDYRADLGALTNGVSLGLRQGLAGSDTIYKRLGELRLSDPTDPGARTEGIWVRTKLSNYTVTPAAGFAFAKSSQNIFAGFDTGFDMRDTGRVNLGIFAGYSQTSANLLGTMFGAAATSRIGLSGLGVGGYASYHQTSGLPGQGFYGDLVGRVDLLNYAMGTLGNPAAATTNGIATSFSAEAGYGFAVTQGIVLQPQAQLIYTNAQQDAFTDAFGARITPGAGNSLVGRAGLQLQGTIDNGQGMAVTPYLLANVMSEFLGSSSTTVGGTTFSQDLRGIWFNVGGGISASLTQHVKVYASGEYNFGAISGWGATAGLRYGW